VKWEGKIKNSWENRETLKDCEELINRIEEHYF